MSIILENPAAIYLPEGLNLPAAPPSARLGGMRRLWTCDEYLRVIDAGFLDRSAGLELIEGEIIEKVGENAPHASGVRLSRLALELAFFGQASFISEQHPVLLGVSSLPEPDIAIVRGGLHDYDTRHPEPEDILLLLEVSYATLAFDRSEKAPFYARNGIVEYWILNLVHRQLEVYRTPRDGSYHSLTVYPENETVSPVTSPESLIKVADLLPKP